VSETAYPDFYLVGAPKCGTSTLYRFLRRHPDIYLPEEKELIHFGSDLSYPTRLSESAFLAHYAHRRGEARVGAAHTAYLQSKAAAGEIRARRPDADIIVMLRNPVEMLPSWHSELLYQTVEEIEDFESALDAEAERRQGRRIPASARNSYVESLYYSDVAAFAQQVERYLAAFGHQHVHVIVFDDFRDDPAATCRATLDFLGVDPAFNPEAAIVNPNKVVRSRTLQRFYFATNTRGHRTVKRLLPPSVRQKLLAANVERRPRADIAEHVRQRLARLFRADVARLGDLIDRDLSHWLDPVPAGLTHALD
jgi:hypothetical protein